MTNAEDQERNGRKAEVEGEPSPSPAPLLGRPPALPARTSTEGGRPAYHRLAEQPADPGNHTTRGDEQQPIPKARFPKRPPAAATTAAQKPPKAKATAKPKAKPKDDSDDDKL